MFIDAEENGPQLCPKQSDSRITRVGWWLRYLHIDEIPQFWNVLKGEMSLIGPRPERPFFTRKYREDIPHYEERTRYIKPGLTGLAQITLGYDESLQTVHLKYAHDINYRIASASFVSWIKIEAWIIGNTIRYLWNHVWRDVQRKFTREQHQEIQSPTSTEKDWHHIAHPWKLIDRITAKQNQSGQELPNYARKTRL
jgi:lipopolysaccharide/colanic/teichoic acid biosynthesis glycosyltransferase